MPHILCRDPRTEKLFMVLILAWEGTSFPSPKLLSKAFSYTSTPIFQGLPQAEAVITTSRLFLDSCILQYNEHCNGKGRGITEMVLKHLQFTACMDN